MNFQEQEENQYSKYEELLLVAGDTNTKGPTIEKRIELRNDIAVKILNNLASDNNEEQDIMLTSILTEYDTLEDYVESLKKSARPPPTWADSNVLTAASALFNVNITVVQAEGANI